VRPLRRVISEEPIKDPGKTIRKIVGARQLGRNQ
jgi:hypothetical protein